MTQAHEVKFVGPGSAVTNRLLFAKEEKKKGLILPGDLQWNRDNRHTLILADLHETAVEFFKGDDDFKIREIDVPDDFFDDGDVAANPEDLEAAAAAKKAEAEADTSENVETTATPGNPVDSTPPRVSKARAR